MTVKPQISTTVYTTAFIDAEWSRRNELTQYERFGLAQFTLLAIHSYLESILAMLILRRLRVIAADLDFRSLKHREYTLNNVEKNYPVSSVECSIRQLAITRIASLKGLTGAKLLEMYDQTFSLKVEAVIGLDRLKILKALAQIRNIIAHGKDLSLTVKELDSGIGEVDFESSEVQEVWKLLLESRVIGSKNASLENPSEFLTKLFADGAILHFHKTVKESTEALVRANSFEFEEYRYPIMSKLPNLR